MPARRSVVLLSGGLDSATACAVARAEELAARTPWLAELCKEHGFRFSPRLHILIWGARRGV